MGRIDDLLQATKLNNLLHKKEIKRKRKVGKIFLGIGIAAGVIVVAYVVYRFLNSRCPDDFEEDFEDDFDDDFFEEELLQDEPVVEEPEV